MGGVFKEPSTIIRLFLQYSNRTTLSYSTLMKNNACIKQHTYENGIFPLIHSKMLIENAKKITLSAGVMLEMESSAKLPFDSLLVSPPNRVICFCRSSIYSACKVRCNYHVLTPSVTMDRAINILIKKLYFINAMSNRQLHEMMPSLF